MRKTITVICILSIILPVIVWGYVSGLKSWVNDEVLTHTDLNSVVNDLNDGFDDAIADISDSLDVVRSALNDTINARLQTSFPMFFTDAFVDSTATNDSLTIEITENSPLGTKQSLFILNNTGVKETVTIILDGFLWNKIGILDSLHFYVWTETINKTDWVTTSVYKDSTDLYFKGIAAASVDSSCSSTARTAKAVSVTNIGITDDEFRIKLKVETQSDSMFIGEIKCFIKNP